MPATDAEYVWLKADSRRARNKLPASAEAFSEYMPKGRGMLPSRPVYRVPAADFDARLIGGGYHGKISFARVNEANVRRCWSA